LAPSRNDAFAGEYDERPGLFPTGRSNEALGGYAATGAC